jgi:hypothetical protein
MKKADSDFYNDFQNRLKQSKPLSKQDFPQQATYQEIPIQVAEQPIGEAPHAAQPEAQPEIQPEVEIKGNGHKDPVDLEETVDVEKAKELARQQEDTRREMLESEKTKAIPGNGYMFNREKKHLLESANINDLQLHNIAVGRIQTAVLKEGWNSLVDMVEDMYLDTVLEGSIAVGGKARVDFVALTQFKNDERSQAAHGSLFAPGPNG